MKFKHIEKGDDSRTYIGLTEEGDLVLIALDDYPSDLADNMNESEDMFTVSVRKLKVEEIREEDCVGDDDSDA
jgi:hypothetical protein